MDEYERKVMEATVEAIFKASMFAMPDGKPGAVLKSGEITRALTTIIASVVASSDACSTPRGTRELIEQIGKDLKRKIAQMRELAERGESPFTHILNESDTKQ